MHHELLESNLLKGVYWIREQRCLSIFNWDMSTIAAPIGLRPVDQLPLCEDFSRSAVNGHWYPAIWNQRGFPPDRRSQTWSQSGKTGKIMSEVLLFERFPMNDRNSNEFIGDHRKCPNRMSRISEQSPKTICLSGPTRCFKSLWGWIMFQNNEIVLQETWGEPQSAHNLDHAPSSFPLQEVHWPLCYFIIWSII
jgi:hypothetical protein